MESLTLETVSLAFAKWRQNKKGPNTPEHLKLQTLQLIGRYPRDKIIRELGISGSTLKRWRLDEEKEKNDISEQEFVALPEPIAQEEIPSETNSTVFSVILPSGVRISLSGNLDTDFMLSVIGKLV